MRNSGETPRKLDLIPKFLGEPSIYPDGDAVVLKVRDRTQEIEEIRRNALKEYKERTGKDFSYFDC